MDRIQMQSPVIGKQLTMKFLEYGWTKSVFFVDVTKISTLADSR